MDASEKGMIFQFIAHQTVNLPKLMFVQKLLFKSSLLLMASATFKYCIYVPQTATTFAFSSV